MPLCLWRRRGGEGGRIFLMARYFTTRPYGRELLSWRYIKSEYNNIRTTSKFLGILSWELSDGNVRLSYSHGTILILLPAATPPIPAATPPILAINRTCIGYTHIYYRNLL